MKDLFGDPLRAPDSNRDEHAATAQLPKTLARSVNMKV